MSKITSFFKPLEGGARPAQALLSVDELTGARRKAFHARFVSRTGADPTKKPVGRTPNTVIALYALRVWRTPSLLAHQPSPAAKSCRVDRIRPLVNMPAPKSDPWKILHAKPDI